MVESFDALAARISSVLQDRDVWSDVLSSVILVLMVLTVWQTGWRGYRPAKHLFEWSRRYPMLAAFYGAFTLMAWGVLGTDYGVRTLLISDNPLVQFLCGFALIAIFLRLSFQFVVLDRSEERWLWTLDTCLDVEHAFFGASMPVRIGSIGSETAHEAAEDSLSVTGLKRLLKRDVADHDTAGLVRGIVNSDRFRIAMAPLVLDFYASILVVFLGLIPVILGFQPLLNEAKDAIGDRSVVHLTETAWDLIVRRGPWLFGVLAGVSLAKLLVRSSTDRFQRYVIEMVERACGGAGEPRRELRELKAEWPARGEMMACLREALAMARTRDMAAETLDVRRWRKLPFLCSAGFMTLLIFANWFGTSNVPESGGLSAASVRAVMHSIVTVSKDVGLVLITMMTLAVTIGLVWLLAVGFVEMMRRVFSIMMGGLGFAVRHGPLVSVSLILAMLAGTLYGLSIVLPNRFESVAYSSMAVIGSIVIQSLSTYGTSPELRRKSVGELTWYWLSLVFAVPFFTTSWSRALLVESGWQPFTLGIVKYLLAIKVGVWVVRWTTTLFDPLIAYPVSAIWGFLAFAGFFVELPEPSQAQVPAAFTVIYFSGVLASAITCVLHSDSLSDPKRIVLALILAVLLLGQGWTTAPNQFKLRFPGLDGRSMLPAAPSNVVNYYEKPVRLNSEAYFRITNRAVIKLHLQDETNKANKARSIQPANRLASGMIPPTVAPYDPLAAAPESNGLKIDEKGAVAFRFFDEQNVNGDIRAGSDYLRLRPGDPLELIRIDTRFDFALDDAGQAIEIDLIPKGLELDFPAPEIASILYSAAESLTIKWIDRQEFDSGIRVALRHSEGNRWKASDGASDFDVSVDFLEKSIRLSGPFAVRMIGKIRDAERAIEADTPGLLPIRMLKIDSAILTASWPAAVIDVRQRTVPGSEKNANDPVPRLRTEIEVRWPAKPVERLKGLKGADPARVATFLHTAYLVAGADGALPADARKTLLDRVFESGRPSVAESVREKLRGHLRLEGVGEKGFQSGDCLSFEFLGWESPAKIADLVYLDPGTEIPEEWKPVLQPFFLDVRSMWYAILRSPASFVKGFDELKPSGNGGGTAPPAAAPRADEDGISARFVKAIDDLDGKAVSGRSEMPANDSENLFVLRQGIHSGVFAFDTAFGSSEDERRGTRVALMYGSHRVREQDRVVLQWNASREPGAKRKSATYEVIETGVRLPQVALPPAQFMAVRLRPIDTRGMESATGGNAERAFQDELPGPPDRMRLAGTWSRLESLDNYDVLTAWKEANARTDGEKPKLVIVTVSGGGIRSEVWTATVLNTLDKNLTDFSKSIRIITGASGGMVAASDFVGSMTRGGLQWRDGHQPIPNPADVEAGKKAGEGYLTRNQLDSVIGQMIYSDIPGSLNPFPRKADRGRTLEKSWARIARDAGAGTPSPFERSIRELAAGEAAGWRPSIVFTPMMVEDGRRLLISNLDLSFVTRNVSALLMEENRRKIKHAAYEVNATDRLINRADDLLSLSAVEFYRIFPDAWQFSVGTATRMSASFPWVAPAVSIPTIPPRRIVDAGYYDNFGVNLAALWLAEMREWLIQNTSGVLLVQIRDHESQSRRTDIDFDVEKGKDASTVRRVFDTITNGVFDRNVGHVLHPILTPLSGAATARSWTMSFRNDEQVELLDELFNAKDTEENAFFRTIVFECPVEASLSWNLSEEEVVNITSGFGAKAPESNEIVASQSENSGSGAAGNAENREYARKRAMLRAIGIGANRLSALRDSQARDLHDNTFGNRKRIQLLKNWWKK